MGLTPKFDIDAPSRYDLNTYEGRVLHFLQLVDPRMLLISDTQLKSSQELLEQYRNKSLPAGVTDEDLWDARKRVQSILHPQTKEPIFPLMRMSGFVAVNIPIVAGMVISPPTMGNIIFWQWVNQTYNAMFNYANRNTSNDNSTEDIGKAYVSAVGVSIAAGVGLNQAVKRVRGLPPAVLGLANIMVPFVAVASAGVFNACLMRYNEFADGIAVEDENGKQLGTSKSAGFKALQQVALTRIAIPAPVLFLPPVILKAMAPLPFMKNPRGKLIAELGVITGCLLGALPCAVAIFPQKASCPATDLEREFHNLKDAHGNAITTVYFNKGV